MATVEEQEYAAQARAILARQHARVVDAVRALEQHIGFIRRCDLEPREVEALAFVRVFLAPAERMPG